MLMDVEMIPEMRSELRSYARAAASEMHFILAPINLKQ